MIKLSIITPVYNGEQFIEKCIQSFIAQKCSDAEHIIMDGASTDGTVEIIKKYAKRYDHIVWNSQSDKGQSDAMNKGIRMTRGPIISFLNVDDYYQPDVLNKILALFEKLSVPSFVVGNCNVWGPDGKLLFCNKPRRLKFTSLILGWDVNPHPSNPSAYFYHKSLHDIVGYYDCSDQYIMDFDFILKAAFFTKLSYFDDLWGNFCFREGTKSFEAIQKGWTSKLLESASEKYAKKFLSLYHPFRYFFVRKYVALVLAKFQLLIACFKLK